MNNRIILLLTLLFGYQIAISQSYILIVNPEIETIFCEEIEIQNGIVKFKNITDGQNSELSIDDVISINLFDDEPDKLHVIKLELDTVMCSIESVVKDKITYREENHTPGTIEIQNVYYVGFGDFDDSPINKNFENVFKQFHKDSYQQKSEVIKKGGTVVDVVELISLDKEKVEIKIISKDVEITTYIKRNEVGSIIYKDPGDIKDIVFGENYILTAEDRIVEVDIQNFSDGNIEYIIENNGNNIDMVQSLNSIKGLYFYDYKNNADLQLKAKSEDQKLSVKFDVNAGVGYLLASAPSSASSEIKEYYDDIRTGFVIETNLHFFATNNFGIGVKYNHFSSSNSIPDIGSDNVKINFIGASLLLNAPFPNNIGYFYVSLAGGYVSEVNNAEALGVAINLKGSTFGADLSLGFDFTIIKNLALGIQGGVMLASIKKFEINGQTVELDDPESLNRLDGLIGLKFYF